jgi:hypothetical protein
MTKNYPYCIVGFGNPQAQKLYDYLLSDNMLEFDPHYDYGGIYYANQELIVDGFPHYIYFIDQNKQIQYYGVEARWILERYTTLETATLLQSFLVKEYNLLIELDDIKLIYGVSE